MSANVTYRGKNIGSTTRLFISDEGIMMDGGIRAGFGDISKLRIEVYGDVADCRVGNMLSVEGNVSNVKVGNCITVEGFCETCLTTMSGNMSSVNVSKDAFVFFGREAEYWDAVKYHIPLNETKATVLRVDGGLVSFEIGHFSMASCHPEIHGNLGYGEVGNSLLVRGNIKNAFAGNRCYATCGLGTRPNPVKVYKETRKKEEDMFGDLFSGMKFGG